MAHPWEQWRTALCPYGFLHDDRHCCYAHSLDELRAPPETRGRYDYLWALRLVDRFYGQIMTARQVALIGAYWQAQPHCRPSWAVALYLLEAGFESSSGYALQWDLGLSLDVEQLIENRNSDGAAPHEPFSWYPDLWPRLEYRRHRMLLSHLVGILLFIRAMYLRVVQTHSFLSATSVTTISRGIPTRPCWRSSAYASAGT